MPEYANTKLRTPPAPPTECEQSECAYAELDVSTNFSFLRGASHPDELVFRATELGYRAIAITDLNSLAGVVRAHDACRQVKEQGGVPPKLLIGARLTFSDADDMLVWATDRAAYGRLCRLLTIGKRRAAKGECAMKVEDFLEQQEGLLAAIVAESCQGSGFRVQDGDRTATVREPVDAPDVRGSSPLAHARGSVSGIDALVCAPGRLTTVSSTGEGTYATGMVGEYTHPTPVGEYTHPTIAVLRAVLGSRLSLAVSALYGVDDRSHLARAMGLSKETGIPLLATNHVHYHVPERRALQDVLTCVRHGCTIDQAGFRLFPNGERYLKSPEQMHRLFSVCPGAIQRGVEIAEQCHFSLDELRYEYPDEVVPEGHSPMSYLAELAWDGAAERYPGGTPEKVRGLLEHELKLIEQLNFAAYFLTVYDIVKFAQSRGILCQGRGSAANSAVCYCIGVTSVDPARIDLLFERFISAARNEPPDIDVDFEHERREEVLQYIYEKYGRERAGMTAEVISYRGRSAVRDVGKALGLSLDLVDQMAKRLDWWHRGSLNEMQLREIGLDPGDPTINRVIELTTQLLGFPRHLSQHVGGMVMTRGPLCELVPIENASMPNRTVIEWDKDDIDALGILKVDCLGLGMLSCIAKAFGLIERHAGNSDEATKRRSDEGKIWGKNIQGETHGREDPDISGFDCMAEGEGTGQTALYCHSTDATRGTIWPDEPDASGSDIDSLKYRGGTWQTESGGLSEVSQESGSQEQLAPSSLRRSVASSLPSKLQLHTVPPEDPAVYEMISNADTIGVFQVESRAQMSMLPRLRPRCFYDLVIEVAIVRPGPIQGNMVHPYLRRRNGEEEVSYPSEALRAVLEKTLGVPLFQEQAMRVAMVGAGFSADEADRLRRAMAAWRKSGALDTFHQKIVDGMLNNGYTREFAEQCFLQIRGFGEYGFPESHAASFALLVYVSSWLKHYYPAAFAAALINSQPMGFYAPAQIVRDAREHGVAVAAVDVNCSEWDCTLESCQGSGFRVQEGGNGAATVREPVSAPEIRQSSPLAHARGSVSSIDALVCARAGSTTVSSTGEGTYATSSSTGEIAYATGMVGEYTHPTLRLGFRLIKGLREEQMRRLVDERQRGGLFDSVANFHRRTRLPRHVIRRLAEADAFASLGLSRREALWHILELDDQQLPLFDQTQTNPVPAPSLPAMPIGQQVMTDYRTTSLSLKRHPVSLVRTQLDELKIITAQQMNQMPHGRWARVAGLVLIRQRPGTASGIVFETIEDETGIVNLIVRPNIYDKYRPAARHAALLHAEGYVERQGQVVHLMAYRLYDQSHLIAGYQFTSRDFH